jgi:hypothetical protein
MTTTAPITLDSVNWPGSRTLTARNEGGEANILINRSDSLTREFLGITISAKDARALGQWLIETFVAAKNSEIMDTLPRGSVVRFGSGSSTAWEDIVWIHVADEWTSSTGVGVKDDDLQDFNAYQMRVEYNPDEHNPEEAE